MAKSRQRAVFAKNSLGQNFLTDPNIIRKIIDAVDPRPEETIIEIGPGRGALTEKLVISGAKIIAIELDRDLIAVLKTSFLDRQLELFEADVLDFDFRLLSNSTTGQATKLVANLPYYISTAVLQLLAKQREVFSEMVLMFQKEVVGRITAAPGESERGYLTVIAEAAFKIEKLFDVPPTAFSPRPKVWSSVVRLIPKPKNELDKGEFLILLSTAFKQKRKTLLNNLKTTYSDALEMLESSGIDGSRRAETLSLDEWASLYRSSDRNKI